MTCPRPPRTGGTRSSPCGAPSWARGRWCPESGGGRGVGSRTRAVRMGQGSSQWPSALLPPCLPPPPPRPPRLPAAPAPAPNPSLTSFQPPTPLGARCPEGNAAAQVRTWPSGWGAGGTPRYPSSARGPTPASVLLPVSTTVSRRPPPPRAVSVPRAVPSLPPADGCARPGRLVGDFSRCFRP